jgi:hypothetical protein
MIDLFSGRGLDCSARDVGHRSLGCDPDTLYCDIDDAGHVHLK